MTATRVCVRLWLNLIVQTSYCFGRSSATPDVGAADWRRDSHVVRSRLWYVSLTVAGETKDNWQKGLPEPGSYEVVIVDAVQQKSGKGDPQIQMKLEIQAGPSQGKTLLDWLTFSDAARWRVEKVLEALEGWPGGVEVNAPALIGARARVRVKRSEWRGTPRVTVDSWEPSSVRS